MIEVTVEGPTGRGVIWTGLVAAVPSVGDMVCLTGDAAVLEVKDVIYDLGNGTVLLRVR